MLIYGEIKSNLHNVTMEVYIYISIAIIVKTNMVNYLP